jgi:type I restriction enzyme S subunit
MEATEHTNGAKRPLPEGWRWVRLGEVCEINPRKTDISRPDIEPTSFVPMEAVDAEKGMICEVRERPFADVKKGYTYFEEGDVLFAKITPCMQNGKHAIARNLIEGIGFASTEFHVIRPAKGILAEWIHHFVRQPAVLHDATNHFTGAVGQKRVPDDFLKSLGIPLPPIEEQRRIAGVLREQMAAVEKARTAAQARLEAVKTLPASLLRQVFPQPGQPLPDGWRWVRLGEVIGGVQAGFACGLRDTQGIAQLRMNNLDTRGNFVWDDIIRVPHEANDIEQFLIVPGDVLFNNTNSTELVGKSALFEGYVEPIVYSNHFTRLRTVTETLLPDFLASWLNHQWQQGVFAAICNKWIGQSAVKADKLLNLDFSLPPLSGQRRIAAVLREEMAAVEQARAAVEEELQTINALPAALLRRAFSGEI